MAVNNSLARQDQSMKLSVYLQNDAVKKQINQVVGGKNGTRFISSIVSAVQNTPSKIFMLAQRAFNGSNPNAGKYDRETLKHWLTVCCRRFFTQQFKRSCLPDGPKVGSVSLSPRGDWRMPSDAASTLWIKECEAL